MGAPEERPSVHRRRVEALSAGVELLSCMLDASATPGGNALKPESAAQLREVITCCQEWLCANAGLSAASALTDRLGVLRVGEEGRSMRRRLADVFDHVEAALRAGVRRSVILEELGAAGLQYTPRGFDSAIDALRRKKAAEVNPDPRSNHKERATYVAPKQNIGAPMRSAATDLDLLRGVHSEPNPLFANPPLVNGRR